jgi:4,5-dihydroxyphthalate decarboxylase
MVKLELSVALAVSEQRTNLTRLILDGTVSPDGIDLFPSDVYSGELIWRQIRSAEFDIAQMSLPALLMLAERGDSPWVALPVFPFRDFHHTRFQVREDSDVHEPKDLHGKHVGVAEYMMTAAVWSRGILKEEFGVEQDKLIWHQERLESIGNEFGYETPAGVTVHQIPAEKTIATMLASGELDGAAITIAGTTLLDRTGVSVAAQPRMRSLFLDPVAENARYFQKTGISPINHTVAVRKSVLQRHPWVALNLYHAFLEAKERLIAPARDLLEGYFQFGYLPLEGRQTVPADPFPYGVSANKKTLETMARYCHEQNLTKRLVSLEEIFSPNTLDS